MLNKFIKENPIFIVLMEQKQLKAKIGVFKFETESERCFVANKVGYAPSISCVKK